MVQNFPSGGGFSGAGSPQTAADQTFSIFADTVSLTRKFHRQIMEQIPDANYLKDGLLEDLIAGGGLLGVASDTVNVYHAEQDSVVANISVVSRSITDNVGTLTVTATSLSDGSTTKYFNYAVVGQIFSTNDPGVQVVVTAVSLPSNSATHTITVKAKTGIALTNYISDGDILRPLGSVVGANQTFGTGSMRGWSRFGVEFQTMETVAGPLPTNAYNQTFEFTLANGQNIIAPRVLLDAYVQDDLKKMAQVLTGTGESLFASDGTTAAQTTMGIFKTIQTFGLTADYAPGALQWNDFITINDQLRNRGAGTDRDLWMGAKVFDTIQNNFSSKFAYGIRYFQQADEKARLGVGFAEFASSEATYTMKKINELNHPRIFSTSGASTSQLQNNYYANCFMVVPNTKVKVQSGLTSRTQSVEAPMFRVLQLEAPVTVGGPKVMKRVYNQAGAELSKENYQVTMRQDFAVQVMLAFKCFFGGTTSIG
jgi:hypothetical protein